MQHEVTFAGFGGQGIMLVGKMLAYAGMKEGQEVVWIPSYGPEMRGGTAYCNVVLADMPIGSPVISNPDHAIIMNRPSLDKFADKIRDGGICIINSSLIDINSGRDDIQEVLVPANDIAIEEGNARAANMVILGAYIGKSKVVKLETVEQIIKDTFAKKPQALDINIQAFHKGVEAAQA